MDKTFSESYPTQESIEGENARWLAARDAEKQAQEDAAFAEHGDYSDDDGDFAPAGRS